ncbi:MAG: TetR/AcrR family transcriptional regulator [Chrysiogenetes bacterium]|nr:TetR/AcrR family transcriptional regulator [Chrysiogenetes bacterium]
MARTNQRHRTRKDLLLAATRLLKEGRAPNMGEIADEAMVSRATAYRYFPTLEALLCEAPLDEGMPDPKEFFAGDTSTDAAARAQKVEGLLHEFTYGNETQFRASLAYSLRQGAEDRETPVRQNRRTPLLEEALAPVKGELSRKAYERLRSALAVFIGIEAMVVCNDVLRLSKDEAYEVKQWAVQALVERALEEARAAPKAKKKTKKAK